MPPKRGEGNLTIAQLKEKIKSLGYDSSECKLKADYVKVYEDAQKGKGTKLGEEMEEEESEEEETSSKRKAAPTKKETASKKSKNDEDEDKPRRSTRAAASKKTEPESESESEEEEEVVKTKKAPAKKAAKAEPKKEVKKTEKKDKEDERDEINGDLPEEEEKKPAKKGKASKEEEDEEGEESDEEDAHKSDLSSNLYESVLQEKATKTGKTGDFGMYWNEVKSLLILDSPNIKGSDKIYGFDMDGTLVNPKSGKKFPSGRNDWVWILDDDVVVEKLKKEHDNGYKIVVFTNQAGIKKGKTNRGDIEGKIMDLAKELGFPLQAFVATTEDVFRKPNCTAWDYMIRHHNGGVKPDLSKCKYIGDAAGRPKTKSEKKDFSCGDRAFALNIGIDFQTPEQFFLGKDPRSEFDWGGVDPVALVNKFEGKKQPTELNVEIPDEQELVVLVGQPASGKSTFAKRHFVSKGYEWCNNDIYKGNAKKVLKVAQEALDSGKSVVLDNTNPSAAKRKEILSMIKGKKIKARAFYLDTPRDVTAHMNLYRERVQAVRRIPDVAYRSYAKNFEEPSTREGFESVTKVDFFPIFPTDEHKRLFLHRT